MATPDARVDALFEPVRVGRTELDNRVAVAPMTRVSGEWSGEANDRIARYYRRYARGGYGLIISEGLYTDTDRSQGYPYQPGMALDAHIESWAPVIEGVHGAGAKMFAQLQHAGAQSQGGAYVEGTVGPSAIAPRGEQMKIYRGSGTYPVPDALATEDLPAIRAGFVGAARRAAAAGFDGIELHGANGYLLDEFLTDYLNHRQDAYGGSTENQVRLLAEVATEVLDAVGDQLTVGIRISQAKVSDNHHKWAGAADDAATIFSTLGATGLHYIHTTEYRAAEPAFAPGGPTLVELAAKHSGTAVLANGHLDDPTTAATVLGHGATVAALGKAALAYRDWPQRVRDGRPVGEEPPGEIFTPVADVKDFELDPA